MTIAGQIDNYIKNQLLKIRVGQTITLFSGLTYTFRTDAGRIVDKQMEYTEHPDDMPALVYYTGKHSVSTDGDIPAELGMENHTVEVLIEGFILSDKAGSQGDDLKLDITCAIKQDPWCGGLILAMTNFETDSAVQIGEEVYSVVKASFSVLYTAPFGSE